MLIQQAFHSLVLLMKETVSWSFLSNNMLLFTYTCNLVVPHVPPQAFGYLHPGVETWTKSSGNVRKCCAFFEIVDLFTELMFI
jgi:hypothetical protein